MPLHITRIAFGCNDADILGERLLGRAHAGESSVSTRYRPKRADELIGGSLYWIIRHRLVARSPILGFAEEAESKRCVIRIAERLIPVRALPRRAHQGWRYLEDADAPADLLSGDEDDDLAMLPRHIAEELSALALL